MKRNQLLQINTEQVIPTIVDDGFHLWESRAIMIYLVEAYGKDDSLYSKIPKEQAVINQRLYFDMGTLYQNLSEYYYPQLFDNLPADPEKLKKADRAVDLLNTFLEANEYVAGDRLTIADFSIIASLSTFTCIGYDYKKFPNVARWYDKLISTIPGHEINEEGLQNLKEYIPESFACCETN